MISSSLGLWQYPSPAMLKQQAKPFSQSASSWQFLKPVNVIGWRYGHLLFSGKGNRCDSLSRSLSKHWSGTINTFCICHEKSSIEESYTKNSEAFLRLAYLQKRIYGTFRNTNISWIPRTSALAADKLKTNVRAIIIWTRLRVHHIDAIQLYFGRAN